MRAKLLKFARLGFRLEALGAAVATWEWRAVQAKSANWEMLVHGLTREWVKNAILAGRIDLTGYRFRWWEVGAYWLCWALIGALGAYLAISLAESA